MKNFRGMNGKNMKVNMVNYLESVLNCTAERPLKMDLIIKSEIY